MMGGLRSIGTSGSGRRRAARGLLLALCAVGGQGRGLQAHHSIAAVYDGNQRVSVEAVVVAFHFVNPHPFVLADVRGATGAVTRWRLELDNRHELVAIGFTADTIRAGDRVTVVGSPSRTAVAGVYVRTLERAADRFRYEQVGGTPRILSSPH